MPNWTSTKEVNLRAPFEWRQTTLAATFFRMTDDRDRNHTKIKLRETLQEAQVQRLSKDRFNRRIILRADRNTNQLRIQPDAGEKGTPLRSRD